MQVLNCVPPTHSRYPSVHESPSVEVPVATAADEVVTLDTIVLKVVDGVDVVVVRILDEDSTDTALLEVVSSTAVELVTEPGVVVPTG